MTDEVKQAIGAVEEQVDEATQTVEEQVDEGKKSESNPLVDAVHRVLLASIGAMALAKEDMEELVSKLVERGEIAEADGRQMLKDVMERRKKQAKKAEDMLDERVEDVMTRMNIPTKDEIEALSAKITALTKKVDELKKTA